MDTKPLIYISTPSNMQNSRGQNSFDSRDALANIDKVLVKKLTNVVILNKKGRDVWCRIFSTKQEFFCKPTDITESKLVTSSNEIIFLKDIYGVEITKL